jgi:hypothetical protein
MWKAYKLEQRAIRNALDAMTNVKAKTLARERLAAALFVLGMAGVFVCIGMSWYAVLPAPICVLALATIVFNKE